MKLQLRVSALLLAVIAISASLTWQSARLDEQGVTVEGTGFGGFTQIGLFIALQVLGLFGVRYWSRVGAWVATVLVALLSLATLWPLLGAVTSGDLRIIQGQVTKLTGIADWQSQTEVLTNLSVNTPAILVAAGSMLALIAWSVRGALTKRQAKQPDDAKWLD